MTTGGGTLDFNSTKYNSLADVGQLTDLPIAQENDLIGFVKQIVRMALKDSIDNVWDRTGGQTFTWKGVSKPDIQLEHLQPCLRHINNVDAFINNLYYAKRINFDEFSSQFFSFFGDFKSSDRAKIGRLVGKYSRYCVDFQPCSAEKARIGRLIKLLQCNNQGLRIEPWVKTYVNSNKKASQMTSFGSNQSMAKFRVNFGANHVGFPLDRISADFECVSDAAKNIVFHVSLIDSCLSGGFKSREMTGSLPMPSTYCPVKSFGVMRDCDVIHIRIPSHMVPQTVQEMIDRPYLCLKLKMDSATSVLVDSGVYHVRLQNEHGKLVDGSIHLNSCRLTVGKRRFKLLTRTTVPKSLRKQKFVKAKFDGKIFGREHIWLGRKFRNIHGLDTTYKLTLTSV